MGLGEGWAYIDTGGAEAMRILCEDIVWDTKDEIIHKRFVGDNGFKKGLNKITRIIKIKGCVFRNKTDFETFLDNMKTLNKDSTNGWEFKYRINSDGDFVKFDGDSTTISVLYKSLLGQKKVARGDGTVYRVEVVNLVE